MQGSGLIESQTGAFTSGHQMQGSGQIKGQRALTSGHQMQGSGLIEGSTGPSHLATRCRGVV